MPPTFVAPPTVRMSSLKALKSQSDDLRNGRTQYRDRALIAIDVDAGEDCTITSRRALLTPSVAVFISLPQRWLAVDEMN